MKALHESVQFADYQFVIFYVDRCKVLNDLYSNEIPEMIGHITPLKSCFVLTDPSDPRHVYLTGLRSRFGTFLNKASASLRQQGDVNTIDAVHLLVCIFEYSSESIFISRSYSWMLCEHLL